MAKGKHVRKQRGDRGASYLLTNVLGVVQCVKAQPIVAHLGQGEKISQGGLKEVKSLPLPACLQKHMHGYITDTCMNDVCKSSAALRTRALVQISVNAGHLIAWCSGSAHRTMPSSHLCTKCVFNSYLRERLRVILFYEHMIDRCPFIAIRP